jgi:hypothetical protein
MVTRQQCTRICTGTIENDADAAGLAERVDEIANDHPGARVKWIQTTAHGVVVGNLVDVGRVRLTAIITWLEESRTSAG